MTNTNVELSKNELELVINSQFILTKNRIIEKVYKLFGLLSEDYKKILENYATNLPADIFSLPPKIYKGENYLGLPYVMMDHPRFFLKDDAFAIRSFFWWGNYFSTTLQLSGSFFQAFRNKIGQNLKANAEEDYFVCINNTPWEHNFKESNYKPLKNIDTIEEILNKPFIKIATKHPLQQWNNAEEFFKLNYEKFLKLLVV